MLLASIGFTFAGVNKLPRFQFGVGLSTMTGPGFTVQVDATRFLSFKGSIGGYLKSFEPGSIVDRKFYQDLADEYLIPGFEVQFSIDRSDKRKLYAFYAFSYWEFSEIRDFNFIIANDIPSVTYDKRLGLSRNHSFGLGYEWVFESNFSLQIAIGYQYQYSNNSDYGWWLDRSPDGLTNHGLGIGFGGAIAFD